MNKFFTLLLLALFTIGGYAQRIDPALEKEMGQRNDDEKIRVFVIMRQQYDREQLNRRADLYTTRAERREFVVSELKQFADAEQYDIRESLSEMQRSDMVTEPRVLWIANAIYFSATKQAIYDLAWRNDVEIIGFDEVVNMIPDGEESKPAPLNRDITPNVTQVNADQVWDLGFTGQGVVVALIDTGVNYSHLDLKDHLWDGGDEFPNHGWDFGDGDNDPMDRKGHGTHCAGTVCGDGGGGRQTGMAPDVTLMCVKISTGTSGSSSTASMCQGIQWAVEQGCDLFSLSFGGHSAVADMVLLRNTCAAVLDAGVIGSIAAGNDGDMLGTYPIPTNVRFPGGCPPPYMDPIQQANPGGLSCSVCVGAVDYNDVAADFTSIGPVRWSNTSYGDYPYVAGSSTQFGLIRPDVCAPGVDIISADYSNSTGYLVYSGTSMATPCVAGCMALMLSKNPELTPADICRILEETALPIEPGKSNVYGYGRVDVLAAVNAVPDNMLSLASYTIHDEQGNNDQQLNAGESVTMDMNLRCGSSALSNATLNITCGSEYVTITNGTIALPDFTTGQTQMVTGFAFSVDESAPVRRKMTFYADVLVGGNSVGHFAFTLAVIGKTMVYEGASIVNDNNGNGLLEPGETANLRVFINNIGNITAPSVRGTLSTTSEYLTINNPEASFGDVAVHEHAYADFSVALSTNSNNAFPMPCTVNLVDTDGQTEEFGFSLFNITATANPLGEGTLTGAGTYGTGTKVTLSATTDDAHTFISWKRGNSVVSYTDYSLVVSENASYVANFSEIDNVVPVGQAQASSVVLPTDSYYNYTLAEQIYTAEELGEAFEISSAAFFNAGTAKTRTIRIFMKPTTKTVFEHGSDWVAPSSDELVFEGSVTFTAGEWKTIYFDRAFTYDGNSNVVLVVDDNTGNYSNGLSCRTFDTDNRQAIYIISDNDNYNPYDPYGNSGYLLNQKNQVLFGIASYDYTVTVSADPTDGGSVSVSEGPFFYGQPCTATATPSGDNVFYYWSENGTRVSTDVSYNFRVMASRNLVAHFGPPVNVTVAAEPAEGGTVSGGGSLGIGQPLSLSATANEGYVFANWTLNGQAVSYLSDYNTNVPGEAEYVAHFEPFAHGTAAIGQATSTNSLLPSYSYYKYALSQQIYTTDEIGGPCHIGSIAFFNTGYEKTRNLTIYLVNTTKSSFSSSTDWIVPTLSQPVFSGEVVMAKDTWTTITFDNEFVYDGTANLALIVDDNSGNWTYNHMSCRVYSANGNQSLRIYSDNTNYDPMNPSGYSGTRMSVKNQIILGVSSFHFTHSGTWSMPSNWELRAIPNATDAAFIDAVCQLDTDAEVNDLTVTDGQILTVLSGKTLTVSDELVNTSTSGLVIKDGAQLINATANVRATMEKDIIAYGTNNPDGWYTIASPMNEMEISGSSFLTPEYDLYRFNEAVELEWENYKNFVDNNLPGFNTFENGRGYLYANNNSFSPVFTGILNVANIERNLSCEGTGTLAGFNLIGNPFPHVIYKGSGGAIDNSALASGFYTLTNEGAWHVHTYDDAIMPGQGILVKTTSATELTIGKTTALATAESGQSKSVAERLRISLEGSNVTDHAFAYFGQGIGLDKVVNLAEHQPVISIRDNGRDYAIIHIDDTYESLDVTFDNNQAGDFTLSVDSDTQFSYLHLIDHLTGDDIDLLEEPSYTFHATGQEYGSRFQLQFVKLTSSPENVEVPFCFVANKTLYINAENGSYQLEILDELGHTVKAMALTSNTCSVADMKAGVYLVRLTDDKMVRTQEVIIE